MSDHSENSNYSDYRGNGREDDVCRDFLRNVCMRGWRCRYRHPDATEAKELESTQDMVFCHDFQNAGCRRATCRFVHCSREEEETYKQTGELPLRSGTTDPSLKEEVPLCKDFLHNNCMRGSKCKFRHMKSSVENEIYEHRMIGGSRLPLHSRHTMYDPYDADIQDYDHHGMAKRRRTEYDDYDDGFAGRKRLSYQMLEDENILLMHRIDDLKKQVVDLTATNEVLLEQNARFRINSKTNGTVTSLTPLSQALSVSQPLMTPAITGLAHTSCIVQQATCAGPLQAQSASVIAQQHATAPNALPHMAGAVPGSIPISAQQVVQPALTNDIVAAAAMSQCLVAAGAGVIPSSLTTASPAAAALAHNQQTQVTIALPSIVPVSICPQQCNAPMPGCPAPTSSLGSLSALPAVSMATLGPPVLPSVSRIAQSNMPLVLSAQSAPLVSYPIMSQSMRSAVAVVAVAAQNPL